MNLSVFQLVRSHRLADLASALTGWVKATEVHQKYVELNAGTVWAQVTPTCLGRALSDAGYTRRRTAAGAQWWFDVPGEDLIR